MFVPFQTCWDRVDRAEVHRQALINLWNAFETEKAYVSRAVVDNDGTGRFFVGPSEPSWTLPFSFELGEMLYQLRSALDSCVYDSAILKFGKNPPPNEHKWQFIITSNPNDFQASVKRMKDLPADIAAIMETAQGYSTMTCRFDDKEFDLGKTLVILNDWARIDRHRKLHLVGTALTRGTLSIGSPNTMGTEYCQFIGGDILENESQIARFKIRNFAPGTAIHLNAQLAFEISVDEAPKRLSPQEIALTMGMGVSAIREVFEKHFGISR